MPRHHSVKGETEAALPLHLCRGVSVLPGGMYHYREDVYMLWFNLHLHFLNLCPHLWSKQLQVQNQKNTLHIHTHTHTCLRGHISYVLRGGHSLNAGDHQVFPSSSIPTLGLISSRIITGHGYMVGVDEKGKNPHTNKKLQSNR